MKTLRLISILWLALVLLVSGCAAPSARQYAQQNEAALQRQQLEDATPKADNQLVYLDMIRTMQDRSLYFASLAHVEAYMQLYGPGPDILRLRADALRETGQDVAAETAYRQLLNTTQAAAAWHGLGLLAAQHDDYIAAVTALREAVRRQPTDATMLGDLGYALLQTGNSTAARIPIAQAAELAPENKKAIANLALLLLVSGDGPKARELMEQAKLPANVRTAIFSLADDIIARHGDSAAITVAQRPTVLSPSVLERFGVVK